MSAALPNHRSPLRVALSATVLIALLIACRSGAAEELRPVMVSRPASRVRLLSQGEMRTNPSWTFAISHGLGGTQRGDRFHRLAAEIKRQIPAANVLLIDWTPTATQTNALGLPQVWKTARQIDAVAAEAAGLFAELGIDPRRTTLIGESFGAYIDGRLALALGGVENILAFNPASELGGYTPLDLRHAARQAWSFHTYSPYDTTQEIAHADFFLETEAGADPTAQHTHGIAWLAERLAAGDLAWLRMEKNVPAAKQDAFRGEARLDGRLDDVLIGRQRPEPEAA